MEPGTKVRWAGIQDERCAPGFTGEVMKVAYHDENSIKVMWVERNGYTWERRKNLQVIEDGEPALVLVG